MSTLKQIVTLLIFLGLGAGHPSPSAPLLSAAAGKIEITPKTPVYLAGYGIGRKSEGVHDPISARCLVLQVGGERIAFVSVDVIGLFRGDIQKIRAQIHSVKPEQVIVSATHTHSGPDTLGQWGPNLQVSGVDKPWLADTFTRIAALVDKTASELKPARLFCGTTTSTPPVSKNIRAARILDPQMGVLNVTHLDGTAVATVVNFACHPEILNTHFLTADFPNWLYKTVEEKTGGVCLYLNGAQGGMVTADFDESTTPKGKNWAAAERIGTQLGECALALLPALAPLVPEALNVQQKTFTVPLDNPRFVALVKLKVFPPDLMKGSSIETEVHRITLGDLEMLTLPGEALPNIGLYLKRKMTGPHKFLLGLTGDELGYILTPEDFGLDLYKYEASVSVGEEMAPRMIAALRSLLPSSWAAPPAGKP